MKPAVRMNRRQPRGARREAGERTLLVLEASTGATALVRGLLLIARPASVPAQP